MQYTIRKVPDLLDEALRRSAREQGKSLNEVAIETLARGAGLSGRLARQRDLSYIAGSWRKDPAFETALSAQDTMTRSCGDDHSGRSGRMVLDVLASSI